MQFYPLTVAQRAQETSDTVTLTFAVPEPQSVDFQYTAGQYITLRKLHGDQELRRSYSMSSSPQDGRLSITVKKVTGGRVSTWLTEQVQVGDTIEVAPPEGRFSPTLHPDKRHAYYLIGAGSGITPLMSILKTVLEAEPMSSVYLLYGSRREEDIIFKEELARLEQRYTGQLVIEYVLSQPQKQTGGLFGLFKKPTTHWQGRTGRITPQIMESFFHENPAPVQEQETYYFLCGPGDFVERLKADLIVNGIAPTQIYAELFLHADSAPGAGVDANAGGARVTVQLKGKNIHITVPEKATILDVLVAEKHNPPYSCTAGACSTCMAKVTAGQVKMDVCHALDDDEVAAGYILTCQAHPITPEVSLSYDV